MMDSSIDYKEALELISGLEAPLVKELTINPSDALSKKIYVKEFDYDRGVALLGVAYGVKLTFPMAGTKGQFAGTSGSKQAYNAAEEIQGMVGNLGAEYEKGIVGQSAKLGKGALVLPRLAIQDQISDLEKISEGIDEKVFDEEEISIIKLEANGLNEKLKYEKRESADPFQLSLMTLRDQRLDEVNMKLRKLKDMGQGS